MKISIINGPNLNLWEQENPRFMELKLLKTILIPFKKDFLKLILIITSLMLKGELINKLHEVGFSSDAILLNAGAYTHTSVAIGDAIKAIDSPVIEIHISNTFAREDFRHTSYITPVLKD